MAGAQCIQPAIHGLFGETREGLGGSSRCSFFVSSSLLWLRPLSDWVNIMTVGMPARATSAASCRGPEGGRCDTLSLANGFITEFNEIGVERNGFDVPDARPFDRAFLFYGEAFAGGLSFFKH